MAYLVYHEGMVTAIIVLVIECVRRRAGIVRQHRDVLAGNRRLHGLEGKRDRRVERRS